METLINNYCMGIQHIGIPTIDIETTVKFYQQLGFNVVLRTQNNNQGCFLKNLLKDAISTKFSSSDICRILIS